MLRQLQISRNTTKLQVSIIRAEGALSGYLERRGDSSVCADLSFNNEDSCPELATFCVTDKVHRLPFGYYDFVVMSGNCECARFPAIIPKCAITEPSTCECPTPVECIEPRDCLVEEDCQDKSTDSCDLFKPVCGNKIADQPDPIDWRITARG